MITSVLTNSCAPLTGSARLDLAYLPTQSFDFRRATGTAWPWLPGLGLNGFAMGPPILRRKGASRGSMKTSTSFADFSSKGHYGFVFIRRTCGTLQALNSGSRNKRSTSSDVRTWYDLDSWSGAKTFSISVYFQLGISL